MRIEGFLEAAWVKHLAVVLIVFMTVISIVPKAQAGFVPTDESVVSEMRSHDAAVVKRVLENKKVGERLKALGYSEQEVEARLSQLSDAELHRLSTKIDSLASGGIIGAVIAILIVVLLVVLILEITDKQIIVD